MVILRFCMDNFSFILGHHLTCNPCLILTVDNPEYQYKMPPKRRKPSQADGDDDSPISTPATKRKKMTIQYDPVNRLPSENIVSGVPASVRV